MQSESELLAKHAGLVEHLARRLAYKPFGPVTHDELIQAGTYGLFRAIRKFDPTAGVSFATYARHRIRGAMLDVIRHTDSVTRVVRRRISLIHRARGRFRGRYGRLPTAEELARELDVTVATLEKWQRDREIAAAERDIASLRVAMHASISRDDYREEIRLALAEIKPAFADVLYRLFWLGQTNPEIAAALHVSKGTVSSRRVRGLAIVRERLLALGVETRDRIPPVKTNHTQGQWRRLAKERRDAAIAAGADPDSIPRLTSNGKQKIQKAS